MDLIKKINSEKEYDIVMERIEELLLIVDNDTPIDDKNSVELSLLFSLIEEYEDVHYRIRKPLKK